MTDDELCDELKDYMKTGKFRIGVNGNCLECFKEYSGHDPFCTAYMSKRKREEDLVNLMKDLGYER